jgi:pimeloyl-ACP methyl ester carboxylesterase
VTLDPETRLRHLELVVERSGIEVPELVLPEDRHILAGEIRLHYLEWPGDGRTVVFLHGGALTAHTWDVVCLGLNDEAHCLAVDLRGHGDSEWALDLDYTYEAHARDVACFSDELELDDFLLVGMSLGGLTALQYATAHSDRLHGLVIVDVGPEIRRDGTKRIRDFVAGPAELPSVEDFVERAIGFNSRRHPELLRMSLLHNLRQLPNGNWSWKYDRRHFGRIDREAQDRSRQALKARLPKIGCPTLVVRGEQSDVFWDEDAQGVVDMIPGSRWEKIPNAGHTIQGDNPAGLLDALRRFLAEID